MAEEKKKRERPIETGPLPDRLEPKAVCGSFACGGCYDIGDGKQFHPPRAGYDQARLLALDGE